MRRADKVPRATPLRKQRTYVFTVYGQGKGGKYRAFAAVLQSGPLSGSLNPRPAHGSALASTLHRERSQGLLGTLHAAELHAQAELDGTLGEHGLEHCSGWAALARARLH